MPGPIDDRMDPATFQRLIAGMPEPPTACCPNCSTRQEPVPLVMTFRFVGAEFYCVRCEALFGFLSPKAVVPTPELDALHTRAREIFSERFPT